MHDINEMVNRFLGWKLPKDFFPDCGISFDGRGPDARGYDRGWPTGTNLFHAGQAKEMFQYCLGVTKPSHAPATGPADCFGIRYVDPSDGHIAWDYCCADREVANERINDMIQRYVDAGEKPPAFELVPLRALTKSEQPPDLPRGGEQQFRQMLVDLHREYLARAEPIVKALAGDIDSGHGANSATELGVPAGYVLCGPGSIQVGGNIWQMPKATRRLAERLATELDGARAR